MEDYTIKNIYSSLKFGVVSSRLGSILLKTELGIGLFLFFIVNLYSIFWFDKMFFISGYLFSFFVISLFLILIKQDKKLKMYVNKCLKDCIVVKANIVRYKDINIYAKSSQICASFIINDTAHRIASKKEITSNVLFKYIGKNVKVLYSSKYDDVLLLKK